MILCVELYSIKASELECGCTLIHKYKVISGWRDHRKQIHLHVKNYAFHWIPYLQTSVIVGGCMQHKTAVSYRTRVLFVCM